MKTNLKILTLLFLLIAGVGFGQNSGSWSNWATVGCGNTILISVNNRGYNKSNNAYYWGIKFRNNTPKPLSFSYTFKVGGEIVERGTTGKISSGGTWSSSDDLVSSLMSKNSSTQYQIEVYDICLKGYCRGEEYASCQNGTLFYQDNDTKNSSNSNYNSNYSGFQSVLNDYNATCSELQRVAFPVGGSQLLANYCQEKTWEPTLQNESLMKSRIREMKAEITRLGGVADGYANQQQDAYRRQQEVAEQNRQREIARQEELRQKEIQRQQEIAQATEQLGTAVEGIFNTIQKNQEKKRQREAEEKRKNEELHANANNGDFDALYKLVEKAYVDIKFDDSYKYAKNALQNSDNVETEKIVNLEKLIKFSLDPIRGSEYKTYLSLFNSPSSQFKTKLIAFGDDYFIDPILTNKIKSEAINKIINNDEYKYENAFFQITGQYDYLGLNKDIKNGLQTLIQLTKDKSTYASKANYFLGLVYEKGHIDGKKDLAKAEKYYKEALFNGSCGIYKSKDLMYLPYKLSVFYMGVNENDLLNQFHHCILSYIGLMRIYSQSSNSNDQKLFSTMKEKFVRNYGSLLSNSDRELFGLPKKTSPFLIFSDYEFFDLESNTPVILNNIFRKDKKTLLITWSKDWCNVGCIKDINSLINRGMDKKYNMIIINVDMKSKDAPSYQSILDYSKEKLSNYFNKTTMLYDKNSLLSQFDEEAAPLLWIIDENGKLIHHTLGLGQTDLIK